MKLSTRRRIRRYLGWLLGVITLASALFFAYYKDRFIETTISIFLFYVFRRLFEKQWHASSTYMCFFVTSIVLIIIVNVELKLSTSILFSAIITFLLTTISYYVRDYFDNKLKIKRIKELNTKAVENLTLDELLTRLPNVKENIIRIVYGYWHKDRNITLLEYVDNCNISQALLYIYINKVKKAYKDLTEIC